MSYRRRILGMYYVYLLESLHEPGARYTGFTANLKTRFASHNAGQNRSTAQRRPWRLVNYLGFTEESTALAFEKYLKTGSGKTFAKRHLYPARSLGPPAQSGHVSTARSSM